MRVWEANGRLRLREMLGEDAAVGARLSAAELDALFSLEPHFAWVEEVFGRVFGPLSLAPLPS